MSSQNSRHQSSTSIKRHDLQFLRSLSSSTSNPSTPSIDSSGPLTPDTVVLVNPFATLASTTSSSPPALRLIGDYELSETKLDDFKCARHIHTGDAFLYKEYPIENLRQRLEPYQRLASLLLASNVNKQLINSMTIEEIAARNHLHFFHDVLTHDKTGFVFYRNYSNNLHTYITDKHRLNENECRQLFSQIVRAMQMCHRVGLIVRDLKLRKIIFHHNNSTHSQLLLTGLDEAIMLSSSTSNDDLVSSRFSCPVYACPEIVLNRQMYSGKLADSWSLGIILYTMLFGRYPFCDRTLVGLFIKIGRCRPDIPRTISIKARSLLRSLIRIKPDERLLPQDILGHVWFHTDRDLHSTIYDDSYSNSTSNHNSTATTSTTVNNTEDAIVPNFQCE